MNTTSSKTERHQRFRLTSRRIITTACILIVAGYILMTGSGSTGQYFNPDIFSSRRIVIAPMLCLTGYLLIAIGILNKKKWT
ncbi:MAG: DUF3098 domain-containing protein [Prevotella sp.]|nr:DUF3098 domain-containing protein [Prevotella sp.]MBR0050223.1 DUF3098 domain-containing protein [Prevotella sp.]